MSVEAFTWALRVPVGGNLKVILLGLANHAHPDGTEAYPALDTLAEYAACDRSTARRNVRKLAAAGWIAEDGLGPRGQSKYRLAMGPAFVGGGKTPPVADETAGGGTGASGGVAPVLPEPSLEPSMNRRAGTRASDDEIPEGFPDELRPHAREAMRVLRSVAERHGSKAVTARAIALVVMARPRKPIVKAAHDFAAWAESSRQVRDVVASYRNWLDREGDLAAVERLPGEGPPVQGANVTTLRPGASEAERRRVRQEERLRRAGLQA